MNYLVVVRHAAGGKLIASCILYPEVNENDEAWLEYWRTNSNPGQITFIYELKDPEVISC